MKRRFGGLWGHSDFMRLWGGQTVSVFGTMISGIALPFTAILALDASALEVAILGASRIVPGLLVGFAAGVWVDRLRRRPLMIAADIGRALIIGSVPLAWAFDVMTIEQLYAVGFAAGVLTMFYDVAYQSYLPTIVGRDELLEGNSKLTATSAISEASAFSAGGWLVQLLSGPLAMLIDAGTYVVSALLLRSVRTPEPAPVVEPQPNVRREAMEGMRAVARDPLLRPMALGVMLQFSGFGIFGSLILLFSVRTLGFDAGVLGVIFAAGGISSFIGALLAGRASTRIGVGTTMIVGMFMMGLSSLLLPFAQGATLLSALLLLAPQVFGDGGYTAYEINAVSLRQSIVPERMIGRVTSFFRVAEMGFLLAGTLVGGVIGETVGLRPAMMLGASLIVASAVVMLLSPLRRVYAAPALLQNDVV